MEQKDIDRVTPLIRAIYYKQKVFLSPNGKLYSLGLTDISNIGKGILVLRQLSDLTEQEKERCFDIERIHVYERPTAKVDMNRITMSDGDFFMFSPSLYDYLRQQSFALPYYDSTTNTTLTPEQMQEYSIIKLK